MCIRDRFSAIQFNWAKMTEKSVENVSAEVNLVAEAPVKTLTKKRNPPPSAEEIEAARKRARVELPEGMSRNQYKKLQRQKKWDETKSEYRKIKKEKKKACLLYTSRCV